MLKSLRCELATYIAANNQRHMMHDFVRDHGQGSQVAGRFFPYFEIDPARWGGVSLELKIQDTLGTQAGTAFDWKRVQKDNIHTRVWHLGPTLGTQNSYDVAAPFLLPQDVYGLDSSDAAARRGDVDVLVTQAENPQDPATAPAEPYLCYKNIPPIDPPFLSKPVTNAVYVQQNLGALAYAEGGTPQFERVRVNGDLPLAAYLLKFGTSMNSTSNVQSNEQVNENIVAGQTAYTFIMQTTIGFDVKEVATTTLWTAIGGEVAGGWQQTGTLTIVLNGHDSTLVAGVKGGNQIRAHDEDIKPPPKGAPPKTTHPVVTYCPLPVIGGPPATGKYCFWPPRPRKVTAARRPEYQPEAISPTGRPVVTPAPEARPRVFRNPFENKSRGVLTYPIPLSPLGGSGQ